MFLLMLTTIAAMTDGEPTETWSPTLDDIAAAERQIVLPADAHPLADYRRYYSGNIINGRRTLSGYFQFIGKERAGVYLTEPVAVILPRNPPACLQLNMEFDMTTRVTSVKCRFRK